MDDYNDIQPEQRTEEVGQNSLPVDTKKKMSTGVKILLIVVVIVIVIPALLIFVVTFLAVPQLQSARSDLQRKSDVGSIVVTLESYAGDNNGNYPSSQRNLDDMKNVYLVANVDRFIETESEDYDLIYTDAMVGSVNPGASDSVMYVVGAQSCDGTSDPSYISVIVGVKDGGKYCQDNS